MRLFSFFVLFHSIYFFFEMTRVIVFTCTSMYDLIVAMYLSPDTILMCILFFSLNEALIMET